ncbi:hypothetical protein TYRP_002595 [Tyrophagus putrescentiae]|nr:hypothetical protein TYRP_002595 [Tyrophagus putrescentiae]
MHPPAGLYFHFGSGATAFLAVTLTFLFLSGTTNGALRCIEDGTGSYSGGGGGGGGANTTGGSYSSSSVAASSDISEVKLNDAQSGGDNEVEVMHPTRAHPPRFIELESSYVPLTIRFPSRTSRLNIIENSGDTASNTVDLVGQDSNRHDSFGRRTGSSSAKGGTSGETSSSSKTAAASVPSSSGVRNLEARVLFGDAKREEPLVLKQDGKTNIPDNMQRIIKCIFPEYV